MTESALEGIYFCINILIPALFPFMVLSSFLVLSGISDKLSLAFGFFTRGVLKLPCNAGAAVILSVIGGYPVGACTVSALKSRGKIDEQQAKRLLYTAFCGGPAFAIFVVGEKLLHDFTLGIIIYICQVLSTLIVGAIIAIPSEAPPKKSMKSAYPLPLSTAFVRACTESSEGMIKLCGMVVIFSALTGIINLLPLNDYANAAIAAVLEVTKGCNALAGQNTPAYIIAAAVGFGGLSVHFQVFSAAEGICKISKLKFILCRITGAVITSALTAFSMLFYTPCTDVFATTSKPLTASFYNSAFGGIILVCMSVCFILSARLNKKTTVIGKQKALSDKL